MRTLTIETTEGRILYTTNMVLSVYEIRQLWPEQYDECTSKYKVTDTDGKELTGEDAHIYLDGTPSQWCGVETRPDSWGAWGVGAERDGLYTLYMSDEGSGDSIYFAMSAERVIAELQRLADAEEGYQEDFETDADWTYFNKIIECIEDISNLVRNQYSHDKSCTSL